MTIANKYYQPTDTDGDIWDRTNLDELEQAFADVEADMPSGGGEESPWDSIDVNDKVGTGFGGKQIATPVAVTLGTTPTTITQWDTYGEYYNIDQGVSGMKIKATGIYHVVCAVTITGAASNVGFSLIGYINGQQSTILNGMTAAIFGTTVTLMLDSVPFWANEFEEITLALAADTDNQAVSITAVLKIIRLDGSPYIP